jgi:hypothetical protein
MMKIMNILINGSGVPIKHGEHITLSEEWRKMEK